MVRRAIDRWADTAVFRVALMFAALGVFPVLLLGIGVTVIGAAKVLAYGWPGDLEPGAIALALLSMGGACGFAGYWRAHRGFKDPPAQRHCHPRLARGRGSHGDSSSGNRRNCRSRIR
jgi:hypothetical protein